jgi:DNA ligase-1
MLAHKYDLKKHNGMLFLAQPKLDGVRCVARWEDNKVVLYSRSGKVYDVKHISDELEKFMGKEDIFDGELYIHGLPLQTQISLVKRPQEASTQIKYWVYDMPVVNGDENLPFSARQEALSRIFDDYHNKTYLADMNFEQIMAWDPIGEDSVYVVETPTYWCDDVDFYLKSFLKDGYEGMMLRLPNSEYLWGYRSNDLLKVKEFQDSEFEIVDVVEGEGKMLGHGIFVCKNDLSEATFKATPKMTMEERAEIFQNKETYIGKLVTVKYFDRTEDQIPRFPVALAVRDYD